MIVQRLKNFAARPLNQKILTTLFFMRQGLAKLPYLLIPLRLPIPPSDMATLWWSYVIPGYRTECGFFEYWGQDVGDLCFLRRILRPGMVFFDVGAYHGLFTLVAAKVLGKRGRVIAFEPSPRELRRLRFHLRLNRLSGVEVVPSAVGSHNGARRFFVVRSEDTSMNSLQPPPIESTVEETTVGTVSLDQYCRENGIDAVDLIKIDVEGGELEVFLGAQRILTLHRPFIICEVLDRVTLPWGYPARQIVDWLENCGYHWFDFDLDGYLRPHAKRTDYSQVKNYLAVPAEKLSVVGKWLRS